MTLEDSILYEIMIGSGVKFTPDEQTIAEFISTYYSGFDLFELLGDFKQVAINRNFTWSKEEVSLTEDGLRIHHELHLSPRPLSVIRMLEVADSKRRVAHEEMIIPKGFQDQGLSRDFMLPYYQQYKNSNVDKVTVFASLEAGGYAWAKYGFVAVNHKEVFDVLSGGYKRGVPPLLIKELRRGAVAFYDENGYSTHFPIHLWAETPTYGKMLLVGSEWHGELNLRDAGQMKVFREYLYKN
ncbi:MAG: hypothetical protein ACRYG7_18785 [Janthinobacterium lividum]